MKINLMNKMEAINVIITFKNKTKNLELKMSEVQWKNLQIKLEANTKFLDVCSELYINKDEILIVEIQKENEL